MALYNAQYIGDRTITWENYTSTKTPLSAGNLNKIQTVLAGIDSEAGTAINSLDTTKADKATVNGTVNSITFNKDTGVFTFGFVNGTTKTVDTVLEKVVINFAYDPNTQSLVLTNADGTTVSVDLSNFVTQYEFFDSDTIGWSVNADGVVTANVLEGSLTGDYLEPNYLDRVTQAMDNAEVYEGSAQTYSLLAQSYAKGGSNLPSRSDEATDNAKYYKEQAEIAKEAAEKIADDNNYVIGVDPTDIQDPGTPYIRPVDVINNLTSTDTDKPLSAMQGKVLKERVDKLDPASGDSYVLTSDIVDNLTSTDTDKPLSANQGNNIRISLTLIQNYYVQKADIQDNLTSIATNKPLSANQGKVLYDMLEKLTSREAFIFNIPVYSDEEFTIQGITLDRYYWGRVWVDLPTYSSEFSDIFIIACNYGYANDGDTSADGQIYCMTMMAEDNSLTFGLLNLGSSTHTVTKMSFRMVYRKRG